MFLSWIAGITAVPSDDDTSDAGKSPEDTPETRPQEALLFVVTFAVAAVFQLAVILKVAKVIDWYAQMLN